jgi:localization factor PodJL
LFTLPGGQDDTNRPDAGASIGEILNTPPEPTAPAATQPAAPAPAAEFAPLPSAPEAEAAGVGSVAAAPNGLGAEPGEATVPSFTSGTTALPGGPTPSPDMTVASLEAAAVRGDAKAQLALAVRYSEGRGVDKDDAKAVSLVTKAAQQGLVFAEYRLGAIYERGVGVPKDLAQARSWYERAAKGGSRKAMHNLAVLYADGVGIPQNFPEAARWFRQGADFGLADSQYNLAVLLERGMGVEKNASEAAKWYAVASSQGDTGAAERLEALKRTMSPADIAMALEAARTFKPKPLDPAANELPGASG